MSSREVTTWASNFHFRHGTQWGKLFQSTAKWDRKIFVHMSSVSPTVRIRKVRYDTNNYNCELNFQAKLSTELTETRLCGSESAVLNVYLNLHSTLHLRGHLRAIQIQTSISIYHFYHTETQSYGTSYRNMTYITT